MSDSWVFTYGAPLFGVLLVAIGIAAAVPGAFGILQTEDSCGKPTISVEPPDATMERFEGEAPAGVSRFEFGQLDPGEQEGFEAALDDALMEAEVEGEFPHYSAFSNGSLIRYEGERYYVTVVADSPCYETAPLQFPLGVFAIALGAIGILTPPAYRRLVELEESLRE